MVNNLPVFALAWVTCEGESLTPMGQGGRILFVEHPLRGWEIPGGHLEEHEQPKDALLRELQEETGMIGRLVSWNKTYYPKGWVGHVVVPPTEKSSWTVRDEKVTAVKWWEKTPPVIEWTEEEFEDLANYFSNADSK
tara:strand:- start:6772 stop:7182 length:411 start_codon:yes stop_codon:yes gene_type:complete